MLPKCVILNNYVELSKRVLSNLRQNFLFDLITVQIVNIISKINKSILLI